MRWTALDLAAVVDGTIVGEDADGSVEIDGVSTDTRTLRRGQLFIPLIDRTDGHAHLPDAIAGGAPVYLTQGPVHGGATGIVVADTAQALRALGGSARDRLPDRVVGVTGSVGKTTVKDLVRAALSTKYRTASSLKSHNNEIGVPLTLANAEQDAEAVVVEMGSRGPGHIRSLCNLARPTVGIVTRVGLAHTEFFGDLEGVARAKAELVEALGSGGTAVLNADDPRVSAMRTRTEAAVMTYSDGLHEADVTAHAVVLDEMVRPTFQLVGSSGSAEVRLKLMGRHQVGNALAAAAAALSLGVPVEVIASGLSDCAPSQWRMSIEHSVGGVTIVNDTYNANPTSVVAALETTASMKASRRIAVLGEMAELGAGSSASHLEVAEAAARLGVTLIAYRTDDYGVPAVHSKEELIRAIGTADSRDVILVKGSRSAGMEIVAQTLARML